MFRWKGRCVAAAAAAVSRWSTALTATWFRATADLDLRRGEVGGRANDDVVALRDPGREVRAAAGRRGDRGLAGRRGLRCFSENVGLELSKHGAEDESRHL